MLLHAASFIACPAVEGWQWWSPGELQSPAHGVGRAENVRVDFVLGAEHVQVPLGLLSFSENQTVSLVSLSVKCGEGGGMVLTPISEWALRSTGGKAPSIYLPPLMPHPVFAPVSSARAKWSGPHSASCINRTVLMCDTSLLTIDVKKTLLDSLVPTGVTALAAWRGWGISLFLCKLSPL